MVLHTTESWCIKLRHLQATRNLGHTRIGIPGLALGPWLSLASCSTCASFCTWSAECRWCCGSKCLPRQCSDLATQCPVSRADWSRI